jgi:hypothetical protein
MPTREDINAQKLSMIKYDNDFVAPEEKINKCSLKAYLSAVNVTRGILALALLGSASVLGYYTYRISANNEIEDFENQVRFSCF